MVKLNPDSSKMQGIENLRKKIDEKEQEYKEQEEAKRKELEELEKERTKNLQEVEKKLEEAVKILEDDKEKEIEHTREHATDQLSRRIEEVSLEQTVQEAPTVHEGMGGPDYDIGKSDLEALPDLYGAVHEALSAGQADSPIVQQARELVYSLDKKDAYISTEARGMFTRDQVEDQYIKRLGALLDTLSEKTGTGGASEWYS